MIEFLKEQVKLLNQVADEAEETLKHHDRVEDVIGTQARLEGMLDVLRLLALKLKHTLLYDGEKYILVELENEQQNL